ncbi:MAG: polysaccharide biosynthesis/export family protein, partial [Tabrizicola sp.]|nr:polysaccharide biosynthesis/export family protein [Tabrizicola sp.]
GRTPEQVQADVVAKLSGKVVDPQVLVTVAKPVSNTVTVGGEVVSGARVPLTLQNDKLLDVIATAGGVRVPVNDTMVHLTRGNQTAQVPLRRVIETPNENISLRPGDSITLVRDPQTFIAYGATGRNAEIPFDTADLTLSSALLKAGGLIDSRSDPSGVFLLRYEKVGIARLLRPDSPMIVENGLTPIIYRLDMRKTESLFLSQKFPVFKNDVIYVTNAPITDVQKAMQVFVLIAAPATTAASLSTAL